MIQRDDDVANPMFQVMVPLVCGVLAVGIRFDRISGNSIRWEMAAIVLASWLAMGVAAPLGDYVNRWWLERGVAD